MRIYENSGGKGQRNGMKKKRVFLSRNENAKKTCYIIVLKFYFQKVKGNLFLLLFTFLPHCIICPVNISLSGSKFPHKIKKNVQSLRIFNF